MAEITRRTWANIRDEAILATGGHVYTGFSTRMEYWLTGAYFDLCAAYHHYEFDKSATITVPDGESTYNLPQDLYIVVGVALVDDLLRPTTFLQPRRPQTLWGAFRNEKRPITYFARWAKTLYFDAKANGDTKMRLDYYRFPNPPDFAATTLPQNYPETARIWDDHMTDAGVSRAKGRIWRPDLQQFDAQALTAWLDQQAQAQTKQDPIHTQPVADATGKALGGAQG